MEKHIKENIKDLFAETIENLILFYHSEEFVEKSKKAIMNMSILTDDEKEYYINKINQIEVKK